MPKKRPAFRYKLKIKYDNKVFYSYARSLPMIKERFSDRVRKEFKIWCSMSFRESDQLTTTRWIGSNVSTCNQRIHWEVFDLVGATSEAGRLLGSIGGSNGRGEAKRRGDAGYYNALRKKGLAKRRANMVKNKK
jgi:hypothetical protein